MNPRLILCGGANFETETDNSPQNVVKLTCWGPNANVYVQIDDVAKVFSRQLSPRLLDLIEIAAYIYTTDCLAPRDRAWAEDGTVEPWGRDFELAISVRDYSFWSDKDICSRLSHILNFLSDDNYVFHFQEAIPGEPSQPYLEFSNEEDWPFYDVERVLMFSGGLDSLAGALETASRGQNLVLVSHRSAATINKRQRQLFQELKSFYPSCQMLHIPIWVNKEKKFGREHTQRTRSFLFVALGAIVGNSVRSGGVRFFENGVVSLNLPVADEVLRARASRTTHPYVLNLMTDLLNLVLERQFIVDNPYLFKTKADVVSIIRDLNAGSLIRHTCSCAHTGFFKSKTQWHCGTCSQCIDRRIAIMATGLEMEDSADDYVVDVFNGARDKGYEKNMAVNYIRHANELANMSEVEMMTKFNRELTRAVKCFPENRREIAVKLIEMHQRHGKLVQEVITNQLKNSAEKLLSGEIEKTSMMMCVVGQQHLASSWDRFAERIVSILQKGIPAACNSHKPENEPHLQEICDGILRGSDNDLTREYPLMKWSSSMTKPDWSNEELRLWVELKYVRSKSGVRTITEDIAADITKYGDNDRKVQYIIYDPSHLVIDEDRFSEPILKHENMRVAFVR